MSPVDYLALLKRKVTKISAKSGLTELTEVPSPPFVSSVSSNLEEKNITFPEVSTSHDPDEVQREVWLERASIAEFDGGSTRADAETMATKEIMRLSGGVLDPERGGMATTAQARAAMLLAGNPTRRIAYSVTNPDSDPVYVGVAIRGKSSFTMSIPLANYDHARLAELALAHELKLYPGISKVEESQQ